MIRTLAHLSCATVLLAASDAARADDPITLVWSAVAGGAGVMTADGFELSATVGQAPVSNVLTDGTIALYNGYWVPAPGVHSRCVGDFNRDGAIDFFDYDDFVQAFEAGLATADVNFDSTVDLFDYDAFVGFFESGCS